MINFVLHGNWLAKLLVVFAVYAWISTTIILGRGVGQSGMLVATVLGLSGLVVFSFLYIFLQKINQFDYYLNTVSSVNLPGLGVILVIGIFLRIAWIFAFPAIPSSDGASYLKLAHGLLEYGHYETAGTRAYWPPGYPFFLMPWLAIFPASIAVSVSQLFLYLFGAIGCYKLAEHFSCKQAGVIAVLLFSIWPNLIALVGAPQKECLILALFPWITLWIIKPSLVAKISAGLALGFAVLVQPSLQLLLPVALLYPLLAKHDRGTVAAVLLGVSAVACIAPWTLRNYNVFNQFVMVSTNGGSNVYRANNELATGGYTERGTIDLSSLDELVQDKTGKRLAVDWIFNNPGDFVGLAIEKQIRFMGDDSFGIYATLKTGKGTSEPLIYGFFKILANLWWLALWLAVALIATRQRNSQDFNVVVMFWLYLFVLHSIFEADGKYHITMLWVLVVWLASALSHLSGNHRDLAPATT